MTGISANSSFEMANCVAALCCSGFRMKVQPIVCTRFGLFWNDTQTDWQAALP
jgi:hypothetical protein